jgi:hypothetical protein
VAKYQIGDGTASVCVEHRTVRYFDVLVHDLASRLERPSGPET